VELLWQFIPAPDPKFVAVLSSIYGKGFHLAGRVLIVLIPWANLGEQRHSQYQRRISR
jgi:hypothetical protein